MRRVERRAKRRPSKWASWPGEALEQTRAAHASIRAELAAGPAPWLRRALRKALRFFARHPIRVARLVEHFDRRERNEERGPTVTKPERPKCGARCRSRGGAPCNAPAVWDHESNRPRNGRCRMHGGLSTGARTPEGRERARLAPMEARERKRLAAAQGDTNHRADVPPTEAEST